MGGHSRFAPSATEREYTCPGSFLLNEQEPDRQSFDAAHGTAAHHVGELCLRMDQDVDTYAGCTIAVTAHGRCRFVHEKAPLKDDPDLYAEDEIELGFEVDDEMVVAVQEYVDRCRVLPGDHFTEVRVEHTDWCPDFDEFGDPLGPQFGTSDHIACVAAFADEDHEEATLYVDDLKYGMGVKVFAFENKQAIKYALAVWKEYNWIYGFKRVVIRIHQPRLGHFDVWELTVDELLAWGAKIKKRLELVFVENPPFEASEKGCKFCKAAARCASTPGMALFEARREHALLMFDDFTGDPIVQASTVSEADLMAAYKAIPLVEIAAKAVETEVRRRLMHNEPAGDLKVVLGKKDRAWKDEEGARRFLRSKGVDDTRTTTKKFASPAQAEKLLPRALWPELAEFYDRPPGGPVIVHKDDPRPAYHARLILDNFESDDEGSPE